MINLLQKSFRSFLTYTAIVLTCSVPAYFVIVDWIWEHELQEHNVIVSTGIRHHLTSMQLNDSALHKHITLWNRLQPERQIRRVETIRQDSIYNVYKINEVMDAKHKDRFQGLISYFSLNGKPYTIQVETNMEESYETILGISLVAVVFFILLLGGLVMINRRMSAGLWKPFYKTLDAVNSFDLNAQQMLSFDNTEIKEFQTLNSSLNKLIKNNIDTFQQQQQFIENAAHELQTPIAVIQSKLDIFLQDEQLTDKQARTVEQAQHAISRVNKINKNLLLLARIENSQFPETEIVDVNEVLRHNLLLAESFITEKQLGIKKEIVPVVVTANKTLVEILISNLLFNAIRYSPQHGALNIELSQDNFIITNSGDVPLHQEHLFKRFGNVSANAPATGLGLAIVKQVVQQHGWTIRYSFTDQQHCFCVCFTA